MQTVQSIADLRTLLEPHRRAGRTIGLVPTMGALHAGHLALIHQARLTCDVVVATIFVNPTQFGPNEDLDRYPRPLETDLKACSEAGVDLVFVPSNEEMYPPGGRFLNLTIHELTDHLCGATRPGHFNGVLLVVNKLFNIIQPTDAWFGQKDIQQLILLETMVREFNIPVRIHRGETVREDDGLAMSSRNRYLSDVERERAPQLNAELRRLEAFIRSGAAAEEAALSQALAGAASRLTANGFRIDYLSVVDERTLQPRERVDPEHSYILAAAAWMGKTRLIDNIVLQSPG